MAKKRKRPELPPSSVTVTIAESVSSHAPPPSAESLLWVRVPRISAGWALLRNEKLFAKRRWNFSSSAL